LALVAEIPGRHHSVTSLHCIDTSALPWLPMGCSVPQIDATMEDSDSCPSPRGLPLCRGCAASWLCATGAGLPAYLRITSRHVAHADPAGLLSFSTTVGLEIDSAAFAQSRGARLPGGLFRGSLMARPLSCLHLSRAPPPRWFIFIATCRFDSMPAPHSASRRRSWHGLRC
jgi:hypothetical protein